MRLNIRHVIPLLVLLVLPACSVKAKKDASLLYPPAPDEPRIAYIGAYSGLQDLQEPSFFDLMFGSKSFSSLSKPWGVFARNGVIYVSDTGKAEALVMDTVNKTLREITGGRRGLALPLGIALSRSGVLFVADAAAKKVYGYGSDGEPQVIIGQSDPLANPSGLAIDERLGRLYVADSYAHMVRVYSLNGEKLFEFGQRGGKSGDFHYPTNIAVDPRTGNVYVSDTQNFRVQVFDKDGKFLRSVGQLGDTLGSFSRPKGIALDSEGHLYAADAAFANIQIFNEEGQLLMVFGSYGSGPGQFQLPAGMYIDEQDTIYVADQGGRRVQVFQYMSEAWRRTHPEDYQKYLRLNTLPAPNEKPDTQEKAQ